MLSNFQNVNLSETVPSYACSRFAALFAVVAACYVTINDIAVVSLKYRFTFKKANREFA